MRRANSAKHLLPNCGLASQKSVRRSDTEIVYLWGADIDEAKHDDAIAFAEDLCANTLVRVDSDHDAIWQAAMHDCGLRLAVRKARVFFSHSQRRAAIARLGSWPRLAIETPRQYRGLIDLDPA